MNSVAALLDWTSPPFNGSWCLTAFPHSSPQLERKSLHTACPVIKGVKWSMPKWIHVGHYAMNGERPEAIEQQPQVVPKVKSLDGCDDADDLCEDWAAAGECKRNVNYMVGDRARPGKCIKSCGRCDLVRNTGAEGERQERRQ